MTDVAFMVGHDDDVVLDPSVPRGAKRATSRFEGMQSDAAIVAAVTANFAHLRVETVTTVEGLLATEAGTAGRAAGDFILAFALKHCDGHAGRRALLGVLFPPSAAAIVLSIAMTRAMWDSLV